jgi:hypothetical protein
MQIRLLLLWRQRLPFGRVLPGIVNIESDREDRDTYLFLQS